MRHRRWSSLNLLHPSLPQPQGMYGFLSLLAAARSPMCFAWLPACIVRPCLYPCCLLPPALVRVPVIISCQCSAHVHRVKAIVGAGVELRAACMHTCWHGRDSAGSRALTKPCCLIFLFLCQPCLLTLFLLLLLLVSFSRGAAASSTVSHLLHGHSNQHDMTHCRRRHTRWVRRLYVCRYMLASVRMCLVVIRACSHRSGAQRQEAKALHPQTRTLRQADGQLQCWPPRLPWT